MADEKIKKQLELKRLSNNVCPECGAKNINDSNFCKGCGIDLNARKKALIGEINNITEKNRLNENSKIFCPKCGTENNDASFCKNCSFDFEQNGLNREHKSELKSFKKSTNGVLSSARSFWNKQSKKSKIVLSFVGIFVLILAAASLAIGATQHTYTDGVISFQYPSSFYEINPPKNIIGGANWYQSSNFKNNQSIYISIQEYDGYLFPTPEQITDDDEKSETENGCNILSTIVKTNPNGIVISQHAYTLTNPNNNIQLEYFNMVFLANKQLYCIQVYGTYGNNGISNVRDMIFNSLKVS